MNNKLTIYIATHKKCHHVIRRNYRYIYIGNYNKNNKLSECSGININEKNEYYNEITALYYIWKNSQSDVVGLVHYRRFFVSRRYIFRVPVIKKSEIDKILRKYDVIVPSRFHFDMTCFERFETEHSALKKKDVLRVREALSLYNASYVNQFDTLLKSHNPFLLNMFILKKELLDKYCTWLFPLLKILEEKIPYLNYKGNEKRFIGLISEYLLDVWVNTNRLKVYECPFLTVNNIRSNYPLHRMKRMLYGKSK